MQKRIDSLQGLRAIMMAIVVVFHIFGINIIYGGGAEAMPFFFILSGFVLQYVYCNKAMALTIKEEVTFIKKRLAKIYPLYFIIITVFLAFMIGMSIFRHTGFNWKGRLMKYFANVVLVQSWINFDDISAGFGGGTWFVSSLMFCYLLFLPAQKVMEKIAKNKRTLYLAGVVLAAGIVLFQFLARQVFSADLYYTYQFPPYRLLEFILGMWLADIFLLPKENNASKAVYTVAEGAIIAFFVAEKILLHFIVPEDNYDWRICSLQVLVFCAMIYVFALQKGYLSRFISCKPLVFFASISYEVYLIHQPLYRMLSVGLNQIGLAKAAGAATLIFSIVLAVLWTQIMKKLHKKSA